MENLAKTILAWRTENYRAHMSTDRLREFAAEAMTDDATDGDPLRVALTNGALAGADLRRVRLEGVDASGAKLAGTRLSDSILTDIDLRNADLRNANLKYADLNRANLDGADLTGATFEGAVLTEATRSGAIVDSTLGLPSPSELRTGTLGWQTLLAVEGMPSGLAKLLYLEFPDGTVWRVVVGCWEGSVAALRQLIARDSSWPEATSEDIPFRRRILEGFCDMVDGTIAHAEERGVLDEC